MMILNKPVDLLQLEAELAAAGVGVNGIGTTGDPPHEIHTYDAHGVAIDLPAEAAAVLAAHEPEPPAPSKNEILLSLLEGAETPAEATEVMLLVQQEMLRP